MTPDDIKVLSRAISGTAEAMGHELSPQAVSLFMEDLSPYPIDRVLFALHSIRKEGGTRLRIKDVLDRVDRGGGHLPGNEAWALARNAEDERNTVVWTAEIQTAWLLAKSLMDGGDKIGARMAFLEAYDRVCMESRMRGARPEVMVSRGWDAATVPKAIERAQMAGLLTQPEAARVTLLIGAPKDQGRDTQSGGLAGLLIGVAEGVQSQGLSDEQRQELRDLIAHLKGGEKRRLQALSEQEIADRTALEDLRREKIAHLKSVE
jgi:hypothetical protein